MFGRPLATAISTLAAACTAAAAAERDEFSERPFFEELPVVSMSRLPQIPTNTPGAVTVFDHEFIRATGYRDIWRILKLVPGMLVVNEYGHTPLVAYHGLSNDYPNRMQVLIDGRSVYSPLDIGGVDWNSLPITIDEIDRIEVVRGSNSAAYGSNAFMGVVNIMTRPASQDRGGMADAVYGQDGYRDGGARLGMQGRDLSVRLEARHMADQGNDFINDYRRMNIGTVRADYRLSPQADMTFSAGINEGIKGWGYGGSPNNLDGEFPVRNRTTFAQLRLHYMVSADNELTFDYYHNSETIDSGQDVNFPELGFPVLTLNLNRRAIRDNFDFQQTAAPLRGLRIAWGGELRRDFASASSFFYTTGDDQSRLLRGFANAEWQALPQVVINAGGMWEHYNDENPRLSPRAFLNWTYVPGHAFRIGYTKAYREPSLFEEHGDQRFYAGDILLEQAVRSSGSLRPERLYAKEAGFVGRFHSMPLSYDVRLFREDLSDLIDATATQPVLPALSPRVDTYVNDPWRVRVQGVEYQLKWQPWQSTDLIYGHAFVRVKSSNPDAGKIPNDVDSVPPYSYSVSWLQRYPFGVSSSVILNGVGSLSWSGFNPTPGYRSVDARIAKALRIDGVRCEIALNALNLGARRREYGYTTSYTPPMPTISRILYVSARAEF